MKKIAFFAFLFALLLSHTNLWAQVTDSTQNVDSVFVVQRGNFFGLSNLKGKELLPAQYDDIDFLNKNDTLCRRWDNFFKIRKGNLCALASATGKPLTNLAFDDLTIFPETCQATSQTSMLLKAKADGKFGLVNGKGDVVIRPAYEDIFLLKDHDNNMVSPEVVCVKKQKKFGFMEMKQQQILPAVYDGIAFLQILERQEKNKTQRLLFVKVQQKGLWGLINLTEKKQYDLEYQQIEPFENELALVKKGNVFGYIDLNNRLKIDLDFEYAENFRQGLALVKKSGKYGLINANGKNVVKFLYEELSFFLKSYEKSATFGVYLRAKQNGKYGVLNTKGEIVVAFDYESVELKKEDFIFLGIKDGKEVRLPIK